MWVDVHGFVSVWMEVEYIGMDVDECRWLWLDLRVFNWTDVYGCGRTDVYGYGCVWMWMDVDVCVWICQSFIDRFSY
jgi:hypothetical protein